MAGLLYSNASRADLTYRQAAEASAADHAEAARLRIERECIRLAPVEQRECAGEARQAARAAQHDQYDLEAQQVTANWTRHMGIAGIFGTAFGIIGVCLVLLTFRENKRAADAAQDANRPWLEPIIVKYGVLEIRSWRTALRVTICIHNRGNSPAVNVQAFAQLVPCRLDDDSLNADRIVQGVEAVLDGWEAKPKTLGATIFPGEPWTVDYVATVDTDRLGETLKGNFKLPLIFLGYGVRYRFGEKCGRTSMARFLDIPGRVDSAKLEDDLAVQCFDLVLGELRVSRAT